MIRVDPWLPDPAAALSAGAFGAGALIRIERSATQTGTYAEITTVAVVASTAQYVYWDGTGDGTTWYRYRISNSGNTSASPYSDPFQGVNPAAFTPPRSYASLDRLLTLWESPITQPAKLSRLATLLGTATSQVIEECGHRDYFRHPATGSASWLAKGDGSNTLHVHEGIAALDSLEISLDGGATFATVTASDYVLRGADPDSAEPVPDGEPYFHVRFTGLGSYTRFPRWGAAVRPTGARGWATPPESLIEATAQRARQLAAAGAGYSGADAGGDDIYGRPATTDRFWPQSLYNFLAREHGRFAACWM